MKDRVAGQWRNLRRPEELLEHDIHASQHLRQQEVITRPIHDILFRRIPSLLLGKAKVLRRGTLWYGGSSGGGGEERCVCGGREVSR